jgi:hypothetical protein
MKKHFHLNRENFACSKNNKFNIPKKYKELYDKYLELIDLDNSDIFVLLVGDQKLL